MSASPVCEERVEDRNSGVANARYRSRRGRPLLWALLIGIILLVVSVTFRHGFGPNGKSVVSIAKTDETSVVLDISVLVFREGLECVLVLAAITAGMTQSGQNFQRAVAVGTATGFVATLFTWHIAARILDDLALSVSALNVQAATGLLAIVVLLLVMNWFFHRTYWTGWISLHNQRKSRILQSEKQGYHKARLLWGMGLLGFTSLYREGFEVVLFLQSYRLRLGNTVVQYGALLGGALSGMVALLTFVVHRRLPYRKMLVLTGLMLAFVLLVMVGEEVQEMQAAHWLPKTEVPILAKAIPSWMGLWFSVFPTVEALGAQVLAGILVFGSYVCALPSRTTARDAD